MECVNTTLTPSLVTTASTAMALILAEVAVVQCTQEVRVLQKLLFAVELALSLFVHVALPMAPLATMRYIAMELRRVKQECVSAAATLVLLVVPAETIALRLPAIVFQHTTLLVLLMVSSATVQRSVMELERVYQKEIHVTQPVDVTVMKSLTHVKFSLANLVTIRSGATAKICVTVLALVQFTTIPLVMLLLMPVVVVSSLLVCALLRKEWDARVEVSVHEMNNVTVKANVLAPVTTKVAALTLALALMLHVNASVLRDLTLKALMKPQRLLTLCIWASVVELDFCCYCAALVSFSSSSCVVARIKMRENKRWNCVDPVMHQPTMPDLCLYTIRLNTNLSPLFSLSRHHRN